MPARFVSTCFSISLLVACGSNEADPKLPSSSGGATTNGSGGSMGGSSALGGSTSVAGSSTPPSTGGSVSAGGSKAASGGSSTGKSGSGGSAQGTGGSAGAKMKGSGGASNVAGSTGSGGASTGSGGNAGAPSGSLLDRIVTSDVTVPAGVKAGVRNYRIWGATAFKVAPVYVAPLANCGTLICMTTGTNSAPNARVIRLDANDALKDVLDLGAFECRGVAAEPDGHFAALLWKDSDDTIFVKRYDTAGTETSSTELKNSDNNPTAFDIGESRLEFGAGKYGAYYHVHSDSGHEGDTLKWVAAATGAETTGWAWGCSHSMSNLLSFNATASAFMPACVTDCYPGTTGSDFANQSLGGIYVNHTKKVLDVAAGCNGSVAAELGGAAPAPNGWKMVFNAHQNAPALGQSSYSKSTMNQDIGFVSIAANMSADKVVWLTTSSAINEADSSIARWEPAGDSAEQYVVGWSEPASASVYKLARLDGSGAVLEGPLDVSAKAQWGQRDDPFRQHFNKDVVWAWFDASGSTTLRFARLRSGGSFSCAAF